MIMALSECLFIPLIETPLTDLLLTTLAIERERALNWPVSSRWSPPSALLLEFQGGFPQSHEVANPSQSVLPSSQVYPKISTPPPSSPRNLDDYG